MKKHIICFMLLLSVSALAQIDRDIPEDPDFKKERELENWYNNDSSIDYHRTEFEEYFKFMAQYQYSGKTGSIREDGHWQSLGIEFSPTGGTRGMGRTTRLAFHPTDKDIFFVGTAGGGVWKTTDRGQSWECITSGIPLGGVTAIAIDPQDPDIMYIGSGDYDGRGRTLGIFKTLNGGDTWLLTGLRVSVYQNFVGITKILVHPRNTNMLMAAGIIGLYRSTDGGLTWDTTRVAGQVANHTYDLELHPDNPDTVYAAIHANGFCRSTDFGATWTVVNSPHVDPGRPAAIAVTPNDADVVYYANTGPWTTVGQDRWSEDVNVSKSTDHGLTFNKNQDPTIIPPFMIGGVDFCCQQLHFNFCLAVSELDHTELVFGMTLPYYSTNSGDDFFQGSVYWGGNTPEYTHPDIHDLVFVNDTLYCASDGGVFVCENFSTTTPGDTLQWRDLTRGLEITQFEGIAVTDTRPGFVIGGTIDNGTNTYEIGTEMTHVHGGDGLDCHIDPRDSTHYYYNVNGGWNFRESSSNGIPRPAGTTRGSRIMAINPMNPNTIYAIYDSLHISREQGLENNGDDSWEEGLIPNGISRLKTFAVDPLDSQVIYVAWKDSIWRTNDEGANWTGPYSFKSEFDFGEIKEIIVHPHNRDTLWVLSTHFNEGNKVYVSYDSAQSWTNYSEGLPNVSMWTMEYRRNSNNELYLGTGIGVFYREVGMDNWEYFGNGMPAVRVNDLEINYGNNMIYAGTFGRGIWVSEMHNPCPVRDTMDMQHIKGLQLLEAERAIYSTALIDGGIGTHVVYHAGDSIVLSPGFQTIDHSSFTASIAPCSSVPTPYDPYKIKGKYIGPMSGTVQELPQEVATDQSIDVYPNPSPGHVNIEFGLQQNTRVQIKVFDIYGKLVMTVFEDRLEPGPYRVGFDTSRLNSGTYLIQLIKGDRSINHKMTVLN